MADTELMASPDDLRRGKNVFPKARVMVRITPSIRMENIRTEPFWSEKIDIV